jgi:hypothetical protein
MRFQRLATYSAAVGAVVAAMSGAWGLTGAAQVTDDEALRVERDAVQIENDAVQVEKTVAPIARTAVTLYSFQATRLPDGRTDIEWRAGAADDLAFRLYREEDGRRKRISSFLKADSALSGKPSPAGQSYSWWDKEAPRDGAVTYWLEVNIKERRTWHGPLVLVSREPRS